MATFAINSHCSYEKNLAVKSLCIIKADISRPEIQVQMNERAEARRQGLALGNYRTQFLLQALQRSRNTAGLFRGWWVAGGGWRVTGDG